MSTSHGVEIAPWRREFIYYDSDKQTLSQLVLVRHEYAPAVRRSGRAPIISQPEMGDARCGTSVPVEGGGDGLRRKAQGRAEATVD